MKSICCLRDLNPYGIDPLTGEADALGLRVLCDYDARGRKIIARAFGLPENFGGAENWNSGSRAHPHVGSILLAGDAYRLLGVFALLEYGCPEVWLIQPEKDQPRRPCVFSDDTVYGLEARDDREGCLRLARGDGWWVRVVAYPNAPGVSCRDRNIHQISGRIA